MTEIFRNSYTVRTLITVQYFVTMMYSPIFLFLLI